MVDERVRARGGNDSWQVVGAAAGAVGVLLFVAGAIVIGERPDFDASGAQVAAFLHDQRARIQICVGLDAAAVPLIVWFLATVASMARGGGDDNRQRRAATVAFGCGLVFVALFLADVTSLAVGALRPDNMTAHPELATTLVDFEFLAMGAATPAVVVMLAAFATLSLRDKAIWPRWIGWLAVLAIPAYALRAGTLFTTDGLFAADGALGLYVPVAALAAWLFLAGGTLAVTTTRAYRLHALVAKAQRFERHADELAAELPAEVLDAPAVPEDVAKPLPPSDPRWKRRAIEDLREAARALREHAALRSPESA